MPVSSICGITVNVMQRDGRGKDKPRLITVCLIDCFAAFAVVTGHGGFVLRGTWTDTAGGIVRNSNA
jgi:hypothetical protein